MTDSAVIPEARGRGIGTRLMSSLVERAFRSGFAALSLTVEDGNRSVDLYERASFVRFFRDDPERAWTRMPSCGDRRRC